MSYVVPTNTPGYVQRIGDPWAPWRKWKAKKLQRFDRPHEVHLAFRRDNWKLAVGKQMVWIVRSELFYGRMGHNLFLGERDVIYMTDNQGHLIDTFRAGDEHYETYLRLLQRGGGKDPHDYRT